MAVTAIINAIVEGRKMGMQASIDLRLRSGKTFKGLMTEILLRYGFYPRDTSEVSISFDTEHNWVDVPRPDDIAGITEFVENYFSNQPGEAISFFYRGEALGLLNFENQSFCIQIYSPRSWLKKNRLISFESFDEVIEFLFEIGYLDGRPDVTYSQHD